jgi:hypothetical protein
LKQEFNESDGKSRDARKWPHHQTGTIPSVEELICDDQTLNETIRVAAKDKRAKEGTGTGECIREGDVRQIACRSL